MLSFVSRRVGLSSVWVAASSVIGNRLISHFGEQGSGSGCIHNIGFIAHIDAGKTTTTEHMLYCAGLTSRAGNVDSGNTVMDYLPPERERGITISSAAISLPWSGCTLNLVDTPGHADFTFEVERTLRVLDGAVLLLDAASGVEAQTVAVWRQAKAYNMPCVAFANKMDSPRGSLQCTAESMKQHLRVQPVLTQLPVGLGRDFQGVVDLVHMHVLLWPQGEEETSFSCVPLEHLPQDTQANARHYRELLLEQVAMEDDSLASLLLGSDKAVICPKELSQAIHRVCVSGAVVPVLCGSALRNVAIQPLMDAITTYFPPASQLSLRVPAGARGLCVYVFKQVHDVHRGLLAFVRVFSGTLKPHTTVHNLSRSTRERVARVLMAQADQLQEVREAGEGRIAVVVGLKNTFTGDTLVQSATVAESLEEECVASLLPPPTVPPPVFLCTVEPSSSVNQKSLEQSLQTLSREDPSLRVTSDPDTGQTVLGGMGELHLEVVEERLRRVFGVACDLGQLQVAYRECLLEETKATATLGGAIGSAKHSMVAMVTLTPLGPGEGVDVRFELGVEVERQRKALTTAVEASLARGPLLGFPVQGVGVCVHELTGCGQAPPPLLGACVARAVQKALAGAEVGLLEPLTELEVVVPEEFVGPVLSDLTSTRRAQVKCVSEGVGGERVVAAKVPLAPLLGYAKHLRSITSGTGSFTMLSSGYLQLDRRQQNIIVEQMRGY